MKTKGDLGVLWGVGVVSGVYLLLCHVLPQYFSTLLAFPWEQLGLGLRFLSEYGRWGNAVALAVYVGVALLPLLWAAWLRLQAHTRGECIALCLLTGVLLFALYAMTNSQWLLQMLPSGKMEFLPLAKGMVGGSVYAAVVLCAVVSVRRHVLYGELGGWAHMARVALRMICPVLLAVMIVRCGDAFWVELAESQGAAEAVMAVARLLGNALPYVLDLCIAFAAMELLVAYEAGDMENTAQRATKLARRCGTALCVVAAVPVVLNTLQFCLVRMLRNVAIRVVMPLDSLLFLLLMQLLIRLVVENRRLQNDNDLFV